MVVKTHQKEDVYKNSFPEEKFNKELNVWNTKVSKSKKKILLKVIIEENFGGFL